MPIGEHFGEHFGELLSDLEVQSFLFAIAITSDLTLANGAVRIGG